MLALLTLVLLHLLSANGQAGYEIQFVRSGGDTITLKCRDEVSRRFLQINETIRYWLNRTNSVRATDDFETDLRMRLGSRLILANDVASSENTATFIINRELEGRYTCGKVIEENNQVVESDPIYLTSQRRAGVRASMAFAVRSGGNVTLRCPYEAGMLSGCYFGTWSINSVPIADIQSPGIRCEDIKGTPESEKYLIDRSTFSLTIKNVMPTDHGNYTCDLSLVDPATSTGQTVMFRSIATEPIISSLSVDVAPLIVKKPEDVIVSMDNTTGKLASSAVFECIAVGLPVPMIMWTYNASLTGKMQDLNMDQMSSMPMGMDTTGPYNGRYRVKSTLVLPISSTDGGTVTCIAVGSSQRDARDARLSVLGAPSSFRLIRSCGGEIVYEVKLPIRHNRLTALKFSYVNSNGEVMPRRGKPAEVEFIDTDTIFYREDRSALPFSNYRVRIALNIPSGSQIKEGPSFTSPQTINANELSRGWVIGISAAISMFVVSLVLLSLCTVLTCTLTLHCVARGRSKLIGKKLRSIVTSSESDQNKIDRLTEEINGLGNLLGVRVRPDSASGTPDPVTKQSVKDLIESMNNVLKIYDSGLGRSNATQANIGVEAQPDTKSSSNSQIETPV